MAVSVINDSQATFCLGTLELDEEYECTKIEQWSKDEVCLIESGEVYISNHRVRNIELSVSPEELHIIKLPYNHVRDICFYALEV